jgi:hypothetical protein
MSPRTTSVPTSSTATESPGPAARGGPRSPRGVGPAQETPRRPRSYGKCRPAESSTWTVVSGASGRRDTARTAFRGETAPASQRVP